MVAAPSLGFLASLFGRVGTEDIHKPQQIHTQERSIGVTKRAIEAPCNAQSPPAGQAEGRS